MSRGKIGCCCGCVIGFCMVFVLLFAMAFGVYCLIFPEAWERTVDKFESLWGGVKQEGDRLVDSVPRRINGNDTHAEGGEEVRN